MSSRLGIDVGGTFTDLLLFDDSSGRLHNVKTPVTPQDPLAGIVSAIRQLLDQSGVVPSRIGHIAHAADAAGPLRTYLGATRVGLLVTEPFEQLLHPDLTRSPSEVPVAPAMPVAPVNSRGIAERIAARGDIVKTLDENQARIAIRELLDAGVEAICVTLLHAGINPGHEQRVRALIAELDDAMPVWLSADLLPQQDEYERTLANVMNASIEPAMHRYIGAFVEKLNAIGFSADGIRIARSDGALMSTQQARATPLYTAMSGPAAAVTGAALTTSLAGYPDAVSFEMGGRSGSFAAILDGLPVLARDRQSADPADMPAIPRVAVHPFDSVAATFAYIAAPGLLRIGPAQAADKTSYRHAGGKVSIADANLVLGRLPLKLPDVDRSADLQAAEEAMAHVADALGLDIRQTARGIVAMFDENLSATLRAMAVRQALDTRALALVAGGGAGPLHANALAQLNGCYPVIVPPAPGLLSALGLLCAGVRCECACRWRRALDDSEPGILNERINELGREADAGLTAAGVDKAARQIDYQADLRYQRQDREITIAIDTLPLDRQALQTLAARFHSGHDQRHGFTSEDALELVNLRAIGRERSAAPALAQQPDDGADAGAAVIARQPVCFDATPLDSTVYERARLRAGNRFSGPALIVQSDSTTLLHPRHRAEVDVYLNLLIYPETAAAQEDQPLWR